MITFTKDTSESEVAGLQELAQAVKIPQILRFENNCLELEMIETFSPTKKHWENVGISLAKLHQVQKPFFGWHRNGFIGKSPQINASKPTWAEFFMENRLDFQMNMLSKQRFFNREVGSLYEKVRISIREDLQNVDECPRLLHGDLWSGNVLCDREQNAVFIDPAVYYGHRETDLAMMKLFGGFSDVTFETYHGFFPQQSGWERREKIYQLYHVLNHANIFGSMYLQQAIHLLHVLESLFSGSAPKAKTPDLT